MSNKKLYALTDDTVMRLERYARAEATVASNYAADDLVPLDREDSVERITEAMIAVSPDRDFITEDEREWYTRDAHAALDALLDKDK